jgi:hypothetical protein
MRTRIRPINSVRTPPAERQPTRTAAVAGNVRGRRKLPTDQSDEPLEKASTVYASFS